MLYVYLGAQINVLQNAISGFFLRSLPGRLAKEEAGSIAEGTHTREDLWREETETKQQTNKNMMQLAEASLIARVTPTPR